MKNSKPITWILFKKEILDVMRDKKTMLAMFLLPVIIYPVIFIIAMQIGTMIGTQEKTSEYDIAFVEQDGSCVTKAADTDLGRLAGYIESKKGKEDGYKITFVGSDDPEADLKSETIDAYVKSVKDNDQITYQIYYLSSADSSNNAEAALSDLISSYSDKLAEEKIASLGLPVEGTLSPAVAEDHDKASRESSIGNILGTIIPFLLITSILMGCMYPAIDMTAGEKERGTLETLLTLPITNAELIMSKFFAVACLSLISVILNVLSMGSIAIYMYHTVKELSDGMASINAVAFIPALIITIVCIFAFALFISALVMCICAFAKSYKEANNYITPLTLVVMMTGYIAFIPNMTLSRPMALVPVANVCLLIKQLLVFKFNYQLIFIVLLTNVIYAFISIWVLSRIYDTENILFGDEGSSVRIFEKRSNLRRGTYPPVSETILIWIIIMLLMNYIGGSVVLKHMTAGVILQQAFVGIIPILVLIYTKSDIKKTLVIKAPRARDLLASILLIGGLIPVNEVLSTALADLLPSSIKNVNDTFGNLTGGLGLIPALLLIALTPAICEEILFRGYMFSAARHKFRLAPAILLVSVCFGISHMSLIKFIPTALLGAFLCYVVYKTDSIFNSSIMHFINNGLSVCIMYHEAQFTWIDKFEEKPANVIMVLAASLVLIIASISIMKSGRADMISSKDHAE
ncbi:MAG: ABC transporter permease subunit/CPBP intramembrane protease [Lachnospiraceae bacterium]|jgi:sodium transport system permease protein|nr:ABC transporter permease subunit/CPBP intramembrane protease [Lachnospiraceae bacterium]MEE3461506.1 ABC transporter permease subunit/CPBP intramembrane protease [Lachnospiraceae bacterium]